MNPTLTLINAQSHHQELLRRAATVQQSKEVWQDKKDGSPAATSTTSLKTFFRLNWSAR